MPTQTRVVTFARERCRQDRAVIFRGMTPSHPDFGVVEIVRKTTTTKMRSDGYPDRKHEPEVVEEVLLTIDEREAEHLLSTLTTAVIRSRDQRPHGDI